MFKTRITHRQHRQRVAGQKPEAHTDDLGDGPARHAAPQEAIKSRVAQGAGGDRGRFQDPPMHAAFMGP